MAFSFKLPKLGAGAKDEASDQMTVSTAMSLEGAGSAMKSLLPEFLAKQPVIQQMHGVHNAHTVRRGVLKGQEGKSLSLIHI